MTDKLTDYGWGFQVKVLASMFTDRVFLQQRTGRKRVGHANRRVQTVWTIPRGSQRQITRV